MAKAALTGNFGAQLKNCPNAAFCWTKRLCGSQASSEYIGP